MRAVCPLLVGSLLLGAGFQSAVAQPANVAPASDPKNAGGWVLNRELSDEFDGSKLDASKWWAEGDGGYYKMKGRAPSQFTPNNAIVEDGKLKIRSKWEPDFDFTKDKFDGRKYENITTAGVVGRKRFLYGYMEVKSKAPNAAMTSSFWTLGYQSELDMYEQMGKPLIMEKPDFDHSYMFSIHDWSPGVVAGHNKVFTGIHQLPFRVADGFHVYGCEWGENYLKFYVDGKLVHSTTQQELGSSWILNNPLEIWFDSEVFYWFGIPGKEEFPCDYEIEYFRLWQKPNPNLLDRAHFGFEGPILLGKTQLPTDPEKDALFWYMPKESAEHFKIVGENYATGRKSLKFSNEGKMANNVTAFSLYGSVNIPAGDYILSMKVWIAPGSTVQRIRPILEEPWLQIDPIEFNQTATRGQWVTLSQKFTRNEASTAKDRLRLVVEAGDVPEGSSTLFIDDVCISAAADAK